MGRGQQPATAKASIDSASRQQYQLALTRFFDSLLLRTGHFSGGILVAKHGQILYEAYAGFEDQDRTTPIDSSSIFHVASTSKTFTSIAILQLVQAGALSLDDSLQRFFPLFPYQGIRVRHLLSHSSGLPNYERLFTQYKWRKDRIATNADVLHLYYALRPSLEFTPGSRFRYCNANFALLALIVEKVSGKFFPDYVHDSIFRKANMRSSYVLSHRRLEAYLPTWDAGGRPYPFNHMDAIYGDKNVYTNCRDLLRYDSAIRAGVLVAPQWLDSAWTARYVDGRYNDPTEQYGLGWRLKVFSDSLKIPYHNGWWHGNNAVFQRLLADSAVIIVTSNRFERRVYSSAKAANIFRPYFSDFKEEEEVEQGQSGRKLQPARSGKFAVPSKSSRRRR
jgi:CubicO group peptidase (beta-lactamase class C family)